MRKPKPFKRRRSIITDPVFRFSWMTQRGGTKQEAANWYYRAMECKPVVFPDTGANGSCIYHTNRRDSLIWIADYAGSNTISHEVMHAMVRLSSLLDIRISMRTEELFAYYQGWLTDQIVQRLYE